MLKTHIQKSNTQYVCKDCGNTISKPTALKGKGCCRSCSRTGELSWNKYIALNYNGNKHHSWKGGKPKCVDCGKSLSAYGCIRCKKCRNKYYALRGKNHPSYGKSPNWHRIYYINIKLRSSWEYLFCYWCDLSDIKWEYEPKTFDLGNTTYTPDFYLPEFDCYVEIKGWIRKNVKQKLLKFNKKFPNICLHLWKRKQIRNIIGISFRELDNLYKNIINKKV
jgi:hypothetical protein